MTDFDHFDLYFPVRTRRLGPLFSKRVGRLREVFWLVFLSVPLLAATLALFWGDVRPIVFDEDGVLIGSAVALLTGLIAAWIAAVLKLYDLCQARVGAVDTFLHEMLGICRMIQTANIVRALELLCLLPSLAAFTEMRKAEVYTVAYDNNIKDLGFLGPNEINHITTFYAMFKGARDEVENFKVWRQLDDRAAEYPKGFIPLRKLLDITSVVYCLFVAFESAYYAVGYLATNAEQEERYKHFIMMQLCDCYVFLLDAMPAFDPRHEWLNNKRRKYSLFCNREGQLEASRNKYRATKDFLRRKYGKYYRDPRDVIDDAVNT